jgi:hypothetical protein
MRLNTRLNLLEKEVEKIKYKFCYSSIVRQDKNGVRWLSDNRGMEIREDEADPDLLSGVNVIILPYENKEPDRDSKLRGQTSF